MIGPAEIEAAAATFGTPRSQVLRDHLISHAIAALTEWPEQDGLTFFGGTALCRTWLPDLRLSEDIDLLLITPSQSPAIRRHLERRLRREFPNVEWTDLGTKHEVETWTLSSGELDIKVQFAAWRFGWEQTIPTVRTPVDLRYSDLPETGELSVPTPSGFAAMKLLAWFDRFAPRDLFDLAALADANYIDCEATLMVKTIAGYTPTVHTAGTSVRSSVVNAWEDELGHQLANVRSPQDCLSTLRKALEDVD